MTSILQKVMRDVSTGINNFKNRYKLPAEFHTSGQFKIMHISDTPESIYAHVYKVLTYSQPDLIIHTGDLVDNLKLEDNYGDLIADYRHKAANLIDKLEHLTSARIIYVPGNHDDYSVIMANSKRGEVLPEGSIIDLAGVKLGLAHQIENLPEKADFQLSGHSSAVQKASTSATEYLNGILNINFLLLPAGKSYQVSYPWSIDQGRQYKRFNMI